MENVKGSVMHVTLVNVRVQPQHVVDFVLATRANPA